jgi:hypothetical protein
MDFRFVELEKLGIDPGIEPRQASGTNGYELCKLLKSFNITSSDSIFDFGAGKATALFWFKWFDFNKIVGIELSEMVYQIGSLNVKLMNDSRVSLMKGDAIEFNNLDEFNYFYFFNPFGQMAMISCINNILLSVKKHQRPITIIYHYPVFSNVFFNLEGLKSLKTYSYLKDSLSFNVYNF